MPPREKTFIKNLTANDLDTYFAGIGEKNFRTKQLLDAIYLKRCNSFNEITNLPLALRQKLSLDFNFNSLELCSIKKSADGAQKLLFKTHDNHFIEAVFLPNSQNSSEHNTICISTMIGCPVNCVFCATAKLGFKRNLSTAEIIEQIFLTSYHLNNDNNINNINKTNKTNSINNIVIMGMGEPLLNFKNILQALDIIISYKICKKRNITLSTIGISQKIIELANSKVATKLALSLHSPQDKVRKALIPNAENIEDICKALDYYYQKTKLAITFEYILLTGINDSDVDIKKLIKLSKRFPSKINIIPYNDIAFTGSTNNLVAANSKQIQAFAAKLKAAGIMTIIRKSQGNDIEAACGQLAFKYHK